MLSCFVEVVINELLFSVYHDGMSMSAFPTNSYQILYGQRQQENVYQATLVWGVKRYVSLVGGRVEQNVDLIGVNRRLIRYYSTWYTMYYILTEILQFYDACGLKGADKQKALNMYSRHRGPRRPPTPEGIYR